MGALTRARIRRSSAAAVLALTVGLVASGAAVATTEHHTVVQEQPSSRTPHALNGSVDAFAQVGDVMFAGGTFTQVTDPSGNQRHLRRYLMAFDVRTGAILPFAPELNGPVLALEPSEDGSALYVGGRFTTVDGISMGNLFKWDLAEAEVDTSFRPGLRHHRVSDLGKAGGRLIVSGTFPKRLAALDPDTGADTGYINLRITGTANGKSDHWWPDVYRLAVNPQETRLVIIGNFSAINGVSRKQAAMVDLGGQSASLSTWYSPRWDRPCVPSIPWYTRDVDWTPDGSSFVIVTAGHTFPNTDRLCSTASLWQDTTSSNAQPVWVNHTGGNSLYSVEATGPAVYVSGHPRWLDNPQGEKSRGPGAVARRGIGAIGTDSGRALAWNPTRTRGHGAKVLYATADGLWVGSDTAEFAGQYRGRIAFVPLP
jgi:hypothetical protein